ncbi:complement C5-like [Hyperolius riggenbachi]|uniref:complement C5-like n=1 Tax=Hyperolius riggenbachi TaxID=752182 RepID=UPI0035A3351B
MILLQIAFLATMCGWTHSQTGTYLVTAPRKWRIGAQETVLIQMFDWTVDLSVKISLLSYPDKRTTYASESVTLTSGNKHQAKVSLQIVPKDLPQKAGGEKQYVVLQALGQGLKAEQQVLVTYENGFLFIQTDKAIYTPDQSVKIRVYSMNEELKPARRRVTLTFTDPEAVKMDVITQDDVSGVISFQPFKIPANPRYGLWSIEATYESDFTTSSKVIFEVKEYVLPRFFVTIVPERNFISYDTFSDFKITVKAKYYYGKKLDQGKAFIRYGVITADGLKQMMPQAIDVMQMENGEATFRFNSEKSVEEIEYGALEDLVGSSLYITTTVEEADGSQSEESENSNVQFIVKPYRLKLIATPLFVKPTLPYHIRVQLKDTLDNPVQRVRLVLTGEFIKEDGSLESIGDREGVTDKNGIALFVVNNHADITALDFRIRTEDTSLREESQASEEFTAKSYKSLTKSYLYIEPSKPRETLQVGDVLSLIVVPHSPYAYKLTHYSYLVISRGKIVKYKTEPRVSGSINQHMDIPIDANMAPSFRVLVYYIITGESTAELITDSIWVDVEEKCVNNQEVTLTAPGEIFSPKQSISLNINAETGSVVALSAVDVAIYDVTKKSQRPLERVLRKIEESDLGCGAGAGENNVDVFLKAGLTFITNANIKASMRDDKCEELVRGKRSLEDEIKKQASTYTTKFLQSCCTNGAKNYLTYLECDKGLERARKCVPKNPKCIDAYKECCEKTRQLKKKLDDEHKDLALGRMYIRTVFDLEEADIRSYFPESWLWEEYIVRQRNYEKVPISLPDSLTTWELQSVGMSEKGICVADPLRLTVFKDLFLDVQFPYSVVRGEQIQIKVTVYNFQSSKVTGCIKVSVQKEVCLVTDATRKSCQEEFRPLVPKTFTYNLLPLELGLHPVTFTLNAANRDIVIKELRVVPEGIQGENSAGFTLDPQGISSTMKRNQDIAFKVPPNIVPKSKITRVFSINGNILGDVIHTVLNAEGVQTLVSASKGTAETELMRVAPIVYVYRYMDVTNEWKLLGDNTFMAKADMTRKLKEGINSILAFRNVDYSYSLRRYSDPSTWLTAFAMRMLGEIHQYVSVDYMSVCNSLLWLIDNCQSQDGSFKETSSTDAVRLQGTIPRQAEEKTLFMTAYVAIGMQKSIHICNLARISNALGLAVDYLVKEYSNAQTTYVLALAAYALQITPTPLQKQRQILGKLKAEALSKGATEPPVYRYWKETSKKIDPVVPSVDTAMMVETTAYALLAILKSGDREYAKPVVQWLKEKERYGGGFYGTQDTIVSLEALTEVAILEAKLKLDMEVTVNYRKSGPFKNYRLTEKNPFAKPVEVPIQEDLLVSTRSAYGVVRGNVRTVYNLISPPEENCFFELKTQKIIPPGEKSKFDEDSNAIYLDVCAKYKPKPDENPLSGPVVMEITLVTGFMVDEKHLSELVNQVDQYVVGSKVEDGKIILDFDWIPSDEFICTTLLLRKMFQVLLISPGILKVYEYRTPERSCTQFFNPYADDSLVKVCRGDACKCIDGGCPHQKSELDTQTTADQRKEFACKGDATYACKVQITSLDDKDGDFVKYAAKILDIFKDSALARVKEIRFLKKKTCTSLDLEVGKHYLMMGKDGIQIRVGRDIQYEYPLDPSTWVEWWPDNSCSSNQCNRFQGILQDFSENILLEGC